MDNPQITEHIEALQNKDWQVRLRAIQALGQIGDKSAARALIPSLNDENENVRSYARKVLDDLDFHVVFHALLEASNDIERSRGLLLASQRDDTHETGELLRASQTGPPEVQPETLLRGIDKPGSNAELPSKHRSLWDHLFRKKKDTV